MKNISRFTFVAVFIFIFQCVFASHVYASDIKLVRVGVSGAASSVKLGNNEIDVYFVLDGEFVNFGHISSNGALSILCDDYYYASTGISYNSYSDAYTSSNSMASMGYGAVPALMESGLWSVYLGPFANSSKALEAVTSGIGDKIIEPTSKRLALYNGTTPLAVFENDRFTPYFKNVRTDTVNINSSEYRGYLDALRSGGQLSAVNVVDMEEYLYSAVASEMPSGWHLEALKAQSVAARCYAYTRMGVHSESGYDLCSSNHCQIYLGVKQEAVNVIEAVNRTKGIVAFYDNEIINATFSSSSGGATDDSENVWSERVGYLRGVSDVFDTSGKEWSRSFSLSELTGLAQANNLNIGSVTGLEIKELSSTGRVLKMAVMGTSGTKLLEKEEIRSFFTPSSGGLLESRNFRIGDYSIAGNNSGVVSASLHIISSNSIESKMNGTFSVLSGGGNKVTVISSGGMNVLSANGSKTLSASNSAVAAPQLSGGLYSTGNTVTLAGRGWGHGVGLSQYGAKGMAEAGYTYTQILKHYYTGIELLYIG